MLRVVDDGVLVYVVGDLLAPALEPEGMDDAPHLTPEFFAELRLLLPEARCGGVERVDLEGSGVEGVGSSTEATWAASGGSSVPTGSDRTCPGGGGLQGSVCDEVEHGLEEAE